MSFDTFIQSLLEKSTRKNKPDETHNIRDLGTLVTGTKAYKFVADFDWIYINEVPVISAYNDYQTAGDVFISMMFAMSTEYIPPADWKR